MHICFYLTLAFLIIFATSSCQRVENLKPSDKEFISYNGRETLRFVSKLGKVDSFTLKGYESYYSTERNSGIISKVHVEHYNLMYEFVEPSEGKLIKSKTYLVGLTAKEDEIAIVNFNLLDPSHNFYFWNSLRIDTLLSMPRKSLSLGNSVKGDVVEIENKSRTHNSIFDSSGISKVYWSISSGLVGYLLRNNVEYLLSSK